eukprot:1825531-Pleurochrysis_carterae.AAC.1
MTVGLFLMQSTEPEQRRSFVGYGRRKAGVICEDGTDHALCAIARHAENVRVGTCQRPSWVHHNVAAWPRQRDWGFKYELCDCIEICSRDYVSEYLRAASAAAHRRVRERLERVLAQVARHLRWLRGASAEPGSDATRALARRRSVWLCRDASLQSICVAGLDALLLSHKAAIRRHDAHICNTLSKGAWTRQQACLASSFLVVYG